jgi:ATP-binding cassette subfamily C protein LapB
MNAGTNQTPAVESAALLSESAAATALCDMAARRGLHAARSEAEQTWRMVHGETAEKKLGAAWAWLFPGHSIERMPLALVEKSRLPAWVMHDGAVGVLTALADDGQPTQVEWLAGNSADVSAITHVLVPVSPALIENETFVAPKRRGPATEAIFQAVRAHWPFYRRAGIVSVFSNVISIGTSLFAMQVYDRVVPNFAYSTLWVLASGVLLAMVFDFLFKMVRLHYLEGSARRMDDALSLYFLEKLMALKIDRRPARVGTLVAQVRDYESIKSFFTSSTLFVLSDLPFIFFFVAVIGLIGGPVALVPLAFLPISFAVGFVANPRVATLQKEQNDDMARRTGLLFEAVSGAESVKAQGAETRFSDVWLRSNRESGARNARLRTVNGIAGFTTGFLQQLAYVAVLVVGVYVIEAGHLTTGGLIACTILSGRVLGTISKTTQLLAQWHNAKHSLEVLNKLLSCPADDDPSRQANTRVASLDYRLNDIQYSYEGSKEPQLAIADLTIKAGERLAVIGRNGGGKSTLLKLFAGIATPSAGQVHLGGLDMQFCRPSWLRETIGYLPQEVRLFSGTLADNLTLGLSRPDEAAIRAAMDKTGLTQTLGRHPLGLNLPIREGGSGLSGGQRQMVALTRLVLQDPKIWLLDEPSASLDQESEQRLTQFIRELPRDRTVVFTSHRRGWLALADRVVLLENGVIKGDAPADKVRSIQNRVTAGNFNKPTPPTAVKLT